MVGLLLPGLEQVTTSEMLHGLWGGADVVGGMSRDENSDAPRVTRVVVLGGGGGKVVMVVVAGGVGG